MKKVILYSLIVFIFSACEDAFVFRKDVLNEIPKNFLAPENYYNNENDAEGAIAGVYAERWYGDNLINYNRLHTDWSLARGSYSSIGHWEDVISSDQFSRILGIWADYYQIIDRSNIVLERVPEIEDIKEATKSKILAEAHFLRGWAYWDLLRDFGPAPIRTEAFTGTSEIGIPRASKEEMYNLILSDLAIAEQDLPETVGEETGRASKWAAKMLLARIYQNREEWSKAAEKAKEVIESNYYSLVPVQKSDDFYNIFAITGTCSEEIFAFHFSLNKKYSFFQWYHGTGTPYNRGTPWGFTNLVNIDAPLLINWDNNDLRKDFCIYDRYVDANGDTVMNDAYSQWRFKKYIANPDGYGIHNIPVFRYPEALLVYAEASCMAEGGPSSLALERLNMVRRRGYGYDPSSPSPVDFPSGMSQDQFFDIVFQERAYEFFFEDLRFWDLKRTGRIADIMSEAHKLTFNTNRLLWPIPQEEIDTNPAIDQSDQNPGY